MKQRGRAEELVTGKLRSYGAALKVLGGQGRRVTDRWANSRADKSHPPFRRCERAVLRFRMMHSLQKFASVLSSVQNHCSADRGLSVRSQYRQVRTVPIAECRALCATRGPTHLPELRRVRIRLTAPSRRLSRHQPRVHPRTTGQSRRPSNALLVCPPQVGV